MIDCLEIVIFMVNFWAERKAKGGLDDRKLSTGSTRWRKALLNARAGDE